MTIIFYKKIYHARSVINIGLSILTAKSLGGVYKSDMFQKFQYLSTILNMI